MQLLRRAMEDSSSSDSGTGWKAVAELQYENRAYPEAYDTGTRARSAGWGPRGRQLWGRATQWLLGRCVWQGCRRGGGAVCCWPTLLLLFLPTVRANSLQLCAA